MADIAARLAITDVLHRYCRAMDRMDRPLALSCWHADGTDEHTPLFAGSAQGFVDWVWRLHEPMVGTRHCLSNIQIEVDGPRAWSESYWDVRLRVRTETAPNNPDAPLYPARRDHSDPSYAFLGGHQTRFP